MKRLLMNLLLLGALLPALEELHAATVITDWNTIASTAIVTNGGKASVASGVWFAYTFIAVYDAVNAVHRMYQPFYYKGTAAAGASDEAAAVAAAHRVLVNYFPVQQADLDAAFTRSLNSIIAPTMQRMPGRLRSRLNQPRPTLPASDSPQVCFMSAVDRRSASAGPNFSTTRTGTTK